MVYLRAKKEVNPAMYDEFAITVAVIIAENNETVRRRSKSFDERIEKLNEVQRGWVILSVWQVFTVNSKNWTDGCGIGSVTAFGTTGRSPNGKGKT